MDKRRVIDLEDLGPSRRIERRDVYFSDIGRRDLIKKTRGLIGAVYVNIFRESARGTVDLKCESARNCIRHLVCLESRWEEAIDESNNRLTKSHLVAREKDVAKMVDETNLRVYLCVKHRTALFEGIEVDERAKLARLHHLIERRIVPVRLPPLSAENLFEPDGETKPGQLIRLIDWRPEDPRK